MHAPRRCPVCGTTHNIINYEYAEPKTMFRCANCDTEFPMLMMPAVPSAYPHATKQVSETDVKNMSELVDDPDAFWNEMAKSEYLPKMKDR